MLHASNPFECRKKRLESGCLQSGTGLRYLRGGFSGLQIKAHKRICQKELLNKQTKEYPGNNISFFLALSSRGHD